MKLLNDIKKIAESGNHNLTTAVITYSPTERLYVWWGLEENGKTAPAAKTLMNLACVGSSWYFQSNNDPANSLANWDCESLDNEEEWVDLGLDPISLQLGDFMELYSRKAGMSFDFDPGDYKVKPEGGDEYAITYKVKGLEFKTQQDVDKFIAVSQLKKFLFTGYGISEEFQNQIIKKMIDNHVMVSGKLKGLK